MMQPLSEIFVRRAIAGMIVIILVASGCVSGGDSTAADGQPTTTAAAEPSTTAAAAEPSTSVLPGPESWNPILATTVAKTAPPAATCPAGSAPNVAGSIDQQRPHPGWLGNLAAAFDQHTGRIISVDQQGETWTFDVCTNRWDQMNPNGFPAHTTVLFDSAGQPSGVLGALVYDVDSDVTVSLGYEHVSVYDADTNTWTQPNNDTVGIGDGQIVPFGAVYDPASGLILTTDRGSSRSWDLWAYDVDTNTWTTVGTIPGDMEQLDFLGYSQTIDRFIIAAWVDRESVTVLLDPRTGDTTIVSIDTPGVDLGWPGAVYGQADDTVFVSDFDGGFTLCGFDTASLTWTCEKAPVTVPSFYSVFAAVVGDPINDRLVLINGVYGDWWSSAADDVWAMDLDTGEWTEVLAPARLQPTGSAAVDAESLPPASTETDASLDLSITVTVSAEGSVYVAFDDDEWRQTIAAVEGGNRPAVRASVLSIEQLDDRAQWAWTQALGEAWLIGGAGTDGGNIMTEPDYGDSPEDVPATFASGTYRLLFEGWVPSGPMLFGCEAELPLIEGQESVLTVPGLPSYSGSGIWWTYYADLRFPDCPT